MKVKKSWWDETDMTITERMCYICHEITVFSRETPSRVFMINNINITTDDVKLLLNEMKNDKLKILKTDLVFSLSSHGHSYVGLVFNSHFLDS
jgi:hypothetical protein